MPAILYDKGIPPFKPAHAAALGRLCLEHDRNREMQLDKDIIDNQADTLREKEKEIAAKDTKLAAKDDEIAALKAQLAALTIPIKQEDDDPHPRIKQEDCNLIDQPDPPAIRCDILFQLSSRAWTKHGTQAPSY